MGAFRLDRLLDFLTSIELVVGLLWLGLAVFTITLVILMQTRWGQSRPLRKCIVLSLLVHLLLIGYSTTVRFVFADQQIEEPVLQVAFVEDSFSRAAETDQAVAEEKPWEEFVHDTVSQPDPIDPEPQQPDEPPEPRRQALAEPRSLPSEPRLDHLPLREVAPPEPVPPTFSGSTGRSTPGKATPQWIEAPAAQRREPIRPTVPDHPAPARPPEPDETRRLPVRTAKAGVPTALLQQMVSLPRLAAEPTTPQPVNSLAGLTDRRSRTVRSEPAPSATDSDTNRTTSGADPAYVAARASVGRLPRGTPPVGSVPDHQPAEADDPGLPADEMTVVPIPQLPRNRHGTTPRQLPSIYRLRVAPDRSRLAERHGATSETEAAVRAALRWLAETQKADGRWDASDYGAGRELIVAGRNRQDAGIQADTGMTGLALLAFLASGHTHHEGLYRENVRRGLEYLLRIQARDGNLAGQATPYAKMYCHSMAAFAMSEAYGMSGDERLYQPVRRAVDYTIAAQDRSAGGWRYRPGDAGDTSQCGWQLMALKSAELAGIPIPVSTRNGLIRYLRTVSSGRYGGLASYRPGERVSRPMAAEALVCWQFLGMPREHPAGDEAGDYLLGELPGQGQPNLYYWYYATLGMYQLQGTYWQRWNGALRTTLIASQRKTGPLAGTWDTDTVWGGYGGRVYTTALATLCLEVYYRFLPLYAEAAPPGARAE